jgi:multimeric flavodoxin WrbA
MAEPTVTKILGVVGSPRRNGNTESLVDAILEGASSAGASSEKIRLSELAIGPCKACNGCQRTGECVQKDDMASLVQLMKDNDVWILGTPVYWWGPTSQFKAFVDRWYGVDQRVFQGKRVIAAIPMGGGNEHYARHIVGMLEDICNYLGMHLIRTVVAPGMNGTGSVRENSRILHMARQAGQEIMMSSAN